MAHRLYQVLANRIRAGGRDDQVVMQGIVAALGPDVRPITAWRGGAAFGLVSMRQASEIRQAVSAAAGAEWWIFVAEIGEDVAATPGTDQGREVSGLIERRSFTRP